MHGQMRSSENYTSMNTLVVKNMNTHEIDEQNNNVYNSNHDNSNKRANWR